MARYSLGFQKASITATGAIVDLACASTDRAHILEVGLFVSAVSGTAPVLTVGLSRTSAVGTRTSPVTVLPEDPGDPAGTSSMATAWSVAPTIVTTPLRRIVVSSLGAGVVWVWPPAPGGLTVPVSGSVVLTTLAIAGTTPNFTLDGYIVVDE